MTDPIADMLTRIRNGLTIHGEHVDVGASRVKRALADVLVREGFVREVREVLGKTGHPALRIFLKYDEDGVSVIRSLGRVSRPGKRVYRSVRELPRVLGGLGIAVLTTSRGILSDREARKEGVGGEILCEIW